MEGMLFYFLKHIHKWFEMNKISTDPLALVLTVHVKGSVHTVGRKPTKQTKSLLGCTKVYRKKHPDKLTCLSDMLSFFKRNMNTKIKFKMDHIRIRRSEYIFIIFHNEISWNFHMFVSINIDHVPVVYIYTALHWNLPGAVRTHRVLHKFC